MLAGFALELAARLDRIGVATPAARANGFAVIFRPAKGAEFGIGRILTTLINVF